MSELSHHGIKGMKWGVRRTPEQLGHTPAEKQEHADYRNAHDRKSVKNMSDTELRNRLNRLNMERQYSQMNPSSVERGNRAIKSALAVIGSVSVAAGLAIKMRSQYQTISKWLNESVNAIDVGDHLYEVSQKLRV